jgi:hypothetical protein
MGQVPWFNTNRLMMEAKVREGASSASSQVRPPTLSCFLFDLFSSIGMPLARSRLAYWRHSLVDRYRRMMPSVWLHILPASLISKHSDFFGGVS